MGDASADQAIRSFLTSIQVGDCCSGVVAAVTRSEVSVTLVGFAARPLGVVGPLDVSWQQRMADAASVGQQIIAEVLSVDLEEGRVWLSMAATENPELWAFLKRLRLGQRLTGTVASIESFGVFVALDEGPAHPIYPGVGFITYPELSWRRFETASEVVEVGQRVYCEFLQFDTWNGEARLSLRATQPDPFLWFFDDIAVGQRLTGQVTKVLPFGVFVRVAEDVEGLVHLPELSADPGRAPEDVVQVGEELTVVVTDIDRERRRLSLSLRQA
ncbi:S1 RNA-binding domain-containing protein [Streptomyces sp. NPDC006617]|uniref:S1 RNA-binding domain-containing protein n=1 Tax=Streptomyces sp. NPDC006617 TaxID=3155354 RepID=UPI0033A6AA4E